VRQLTARADVSAVPGRTLLSPPPLLLSRDEYGSNRECAGIRAIPQESFAITYHYSAWLAEPPRLQVDYRTRSRSILRLLPLPPYMRGSRPSHRRSSLSRLRPGYALESSAARARISDISGDKIFFFLILSNNHAAIPNGARFGETRTRSLGNIEKRGASHFSSIKTELLFAVIQKLYRSAVGKGGGGEMTRGTEVHGRQRANRLRAQSADLKGNVHPSDFSVYT